MITRGRFCLLIGIFMLFINNYQSQVTERKENGRAGPKNNSDGAIFRISNQIKPGLNSFCITVPRMINTSLVTENRSQPLDNLGRENNFRQQIKNLFPLFNLIADQMEIDFSL